MFAYLRSEMVVTVEALVKRLEKKPPIVDDLKAFGVVEGKERIWESLNDSVLSRIGKKCNTKIFPKRA